MGSNAMKIDVRLDRARFSQKETKLSFEGKLDGPFVCKAPTSAINEKDHEFIKLWIMFIGMGLFDKFQKQNYEELGIKWTMSYQCGEMWYSSILHNSSNKK